MQSLIKLRKPMTVINPFTTGKGLIMTMLVYSGELMVLKTFVDFFLIGMYQ